MREVLSLLENQAGGLVALALVVVLALVRAMVRDPSHRAELRSAITLFLLYLVTFVVAQVLEAQALAEPAQYTRIASYVLFAFAVLRTTTSAIVWVLRSRRGRVTPKIVRDVIDGVLYLIALAVVLRSTLKVDLGGLLATSAILSVVIGLALQETLGNLFAGLSLQIETPFSVGDWVTVGAHTGKVVQVGWRQTRIVTFRNESVTIPNSVIGKEFVTNFSRSTQGVARDLYVEIDYDSPPHAVRAACLDVVASHPKVRKDPPPLFRVSKWDASGLIYQVRFFLDRFEDVEPVAAELLSLLWYRVRREGFSIPFPTRTVLLQQPKGAAEREADQRDLAALLATVGFLKPLGVEGLSRLALLSRVQLFEVGEPIIRQGEAGESFYVVVSGEVSVHAEGNAAEVARLRRGDFFGEMSLLTGEPRAATVIAARDSTLLCVDRRAFGEILKAHEELARSLSDALAERTANLKAHVAGAEPTGTVKAESNRIFARLRDIFRLR
jgi:small-conductance mechanosensitive channel/tellurite resistance protein